eukprot:15453579-Alexandrium_andersonii.AAC.1
MAASPKAQSFTPRTCLQARTPEVEARKGQLSTWGPRPRSEVPGKPVLARTRWAGMHVRSRLDQT